MTAVIRRAEARRRQSMKISSSIRFSLTGGQVDWMTKTSRPRTSSSSLTISSPSGKFSTWARPIAHAEVIADPLGQRRVAASGEYLQAVH